MTLRALLADDEPPALERLQALFHGMADVRVVGTAADGCEAAALIRSARPDLVFLDIRMPGRDGLSLARALSSEAGRSPQVIFVTAFEHFAAEAFEVDAVDYLLKPVSAERLRNALIRARRRRVLGPPAAEAREGVPEPYTDAFWIKRPDKALRVPVGSIRWIEAAGDYVLLHTEGRSHMLRSTMEAIGRQLDPAGLVRVSRSAFVRPELVAAFSRNSESLVLTLTDGTTVSVGRSYLDGVRRRFGLGGRGALARRSANP